MINIYISGDFFDSQSEAAALETIIDSFRRFSGLFYEDFSLNLSKNRDLAKKNLISIEVDGVLNEFAFWKESDSASVIPMVKALFGKLSFFCNQLKDSIELFCKHELWALEIPFLFCGKSRRVRKELLESYPIDLIEETAHQNVDMNYNLDYLNCYYKYLVMKMKNDNLENVSQNIIHKSYYDYTQKMYEKWKFSKKILYYRLACIVAENTEEMDFVEDIYNGYIFNLKNLDQDVNYELSNACYDFARYFEKFFDKFYGKKQSELRNRTMYYYQKSLVYRNDNFRAMYKCALNAESLYDSNHGMIAKLNKLKEFLEEKERTIESNLRVFLYNYKVLYHMGVLELKINANRNRAIQLFTEAEHLFEVSILNIWKRLSLNKKWDGAERELLSFVHAEMLYGYMASVYLQREGIESPEYKDIQYKRKLLKNGYMI